MFASLVCFCQPGSSPWTRCDMLLRPGQWNLAHLSERPKRPEYRAKWCSTSVLWGGPKFTKFRKFFLLHSTSITGTFEVPQPCPYRRDCYASRYATPTQLSPPLDKVFQNVTLRAVLLGPAPAELTPGGSSFLLTNNL